jgi:predicted Zn-dependent peptidase
MLESERFKSLKINNRGFLIQKNRHIQKLEQLAKYNGYYKAYLWTNSKLFANSIYQYSLMGTSLKLKNLKLSDIKSVYKRYSNPQLATLVISGEFDTVEVKKNINKYFSNISAVRGEKLKYSSFNFTNESISKSLVATKNAENFIIIGIPAPSVLNYNFIHFLFMKYFLFDKRIGNIENLLKNKNNLDITMDYKLTDNIEANSLILGISSTKKIDVIRARYLILKYINNLPMTMLKKKKDIQSIKRLMEIDYLKNLSGLLSRSEVLAKSEHFFGDIDVNKNILRKIKNINLLSLVNVCKRYFVKNKMVMLFEYNDD